MTAKEFLFALPDKVNPDSVEGMETVFHFDLSDDEEGGQYTLSLKDGTLVASEGLDGDAKCTIKASSQNFVKLAQGELNPMMALLTGKVKITNQGEMLKYAKLFGLM